MTRSFAGQLPAWAVQAADDTLRTTLAYVPPASQHASGTAASNTPAPRPGRHKPQRPAVAWTAADARRFLASAHADRDPLLAAYVLVLVNALTRDEVLGLSWSSVDLLAGEINVAWQLQRTGHRLVHEERVLPRSAIDRFRLPMPGLCAAALLVRRSRQAVARSATGAAWADSDLVFTNRRGASIDPGSFTRAFGARCARAGVPRIRITDTRYVCAPLLARFGVGTQEATQIVRHAGIALTAGGHATVPVPVIATALGRPQVRGPGGATGADGVWS
jgi:integrase